MSTFEPLATVGDAIASFLDSPEPKTSRMGAVSAEDVYKGFYTWDMAGTDPIQSYSLAEKLPVIAFRRDSRKWGGVPSVSTWLSFSMGCGFAVIAAVLALVAWNDELSTSSLNTFITEYLVHASSSWPLLGNVVFANSPQLLISLLYLSSNRILTTMLTAYECGKFAGERRALRVSRPQGEQRSTFWLQLPYRYILPLMATTAVLHWMMSRSLYFVDVEGYNDPNHPPGWRIAFAAGYSVLGMSISLFIAVGICLALVALACRSLNPGIPVMGSCSLALSAACHPLPEESDVASQKLMYGVFASTSGDARSRVGFSSKSVEPLVDDVVYS